jgi:hypothetical protein
MIELFPRIEESPFPYNLRSTNELSRVSWKPSHSTIQCFSFKIGMQAEQESAIFTALAQCGSLRSISFQLFRSHWTNDTHRVHHVVNAAIEKFESMRPLTGGRRREIKLLFEDGKGEVLHIESRGGMSRDVD